MNILRSGLVLLFIAAASGARADGRVDAVTNRVAEIIASGQYAFSIAFGRQGGLVTDGYAMRTSGAFRVSLAGREMLRVVDRQLWIPSTGTGGAARVLFDWPLRVQCAYAANHSGAFGFGIMPPEKKQPFLMANYSGLNDRIASLPLVRKQDGGWRFCETNETGTCVEFGQPAGSSLFIMLAKTEADKSATYIDELKISDGPPAQIITLPETERIVPLHDFTISLIFCARLVSALERAVAEEKNADEVFAEFGRFCDRAQAGLDGKLPPLPPSVKHQP